MVEIPDYYNNVCLFYNQVDPECTFISYTE